MHVSSTAGLGAQNLKGMNNIQIAQYVSQTLNAAAVQCVQRWNTMVVQGVAHLQAQHAQILAATPQNQQADLHRQQTADIAAARQARGLVFVANVEAMERAKETVGQTMTSAGVPSKAVPYNFEQLSQQVQVPNTVVTSTWGNMPAGAWFNNQCYPFLP